MFKCIIKKTGGVQKKESTTAKAGRDRAEISFVLNRGYGGAIGKNRKSSNFVREGVEKVELKSRKCRISTFPGSDRLALARHALPH